LVVDDDRGIRETLTAALELDGYEVAAAPDGAAALDHLEGERPVLVVLDIMMPGMDGFAFADELRRRGLRAGLPILVLTADGRAREKAARVGAEGWLAKPFDVAELLDRVAALAGPA